MKAFTFDRCPYENVYIKGIVDENVYIKGI